MYQNTSNWTTRNSRNYSSSSSENTHNCVGNLISSSNFSLWSHAIFNILFIFSNSISSFLFCCFCCVQSTFLFISISLCFIKGFVLFFYIISAFFFNDIIKRFLSIIKFCFRFLSFRRICTMLFNNCIIFSLSSIKISFSSFDVFSSLLLYKLIHVSIACINKILRNIKFCLSCSSFRYSITKFSFMFLQTSTSFFFSFCCN